jgi:ABC-type sugar transport system permease subunit
VVAAWPVIVQGKLVGLAAVEQAPTHVGKLLLVPALLLLAACLILIALVLWKTTIDRRLALAIPGLIVIAGAIIMLVSHQRSVADESLLQRDLAATRVLNTAEWTRPDAIAQLDHKWDEIFGQDAPAELTRLPNGAAIVAAPPSAATSEALSLALPVALVALSILALAVLGLKGTAGIVWGLVRMPGVYGYVAPAMVGMLVLVLVPFLMGVALAFFNQDYDFVGLQNFQTILFPSGTSDTNFYFTLGVTVLWTVSNIFLHVAIGLFMALILVNPKVRFKGLFRVLLIVPWAVPNYITALIWRWMFTSKIGAINRILESIGIQGPEWFGQSFWANFGANLATNVWLGFPFMMVVAMGALQSIPAELYEAADVDGASRWQKFRNITLPLLKPALFPAIILGTIWTFNMFNVIYLVSRGGPDNQTNILITEAYRFFKELNQYGIAAAYCILIFVILMLYTLVTNKVTKATKGAFE